MVAGSSISRTTPISLTFKLRKSWPYSEFGYVLDVSMPPVAIPTFLNYLENIQEIHRHAVGHFFCSRSDWSTVLCHRYFPCRLHSPPS